MSRVFEKQEEETLRQIMRWRRDVRGNRFLAEKLREEDLDAIIEAALLAPSVGYSQPWRMVMIDDSETREAVLENFRRVNEEAAREFAGSRGDLYSSLKLEGIQEASHLMAVFYHEGDGPILGQYSMKEAGPYSVVCAIQNMWLMARARNIGLGWVSIVDQLSLSELLGAPPKHKLVALLCLGYVDEFPEEPELKTKGWGSAKSRDELVFRNKFS